MRYFQCRLRQRNTTIIGWIEERGAKAGVFVEIPECGGFWQVASVCPKPIEAQWLREKQRMDRRGMPDI